MVNLWMLRDARWSAFKRITQASIFSLVFIVGAFSYLAWDNEQLVWTLSEGRTPQQTR